jgi:hypothetical protein
MDNFDLKKYLVENKLTKTSKLDENYTDYNVGDVYQLSNGEKFEVLPLPDKFKGKFGAGTLNIWMKNLQTGEEHFVPQSNLRGWTKTK